MRYLVLALALTGCGDFDETMEANDQRKVTVESEDADLVGEVATEADASPVEEDTEEPTPEATPAAIVVEEVLPPVEEQVLPIEAILATRRGPVEAALPDEEVVPLPWMPADFINVMTNVFPSDMVRTVIYYNFFETQGGRCPEATSSGVIWAVCIPNEHGVKRWYGFSRTHIYIDTYEGVYPK